MYHKPFRIDLKNLPDGGKEIEGTLPPSFFGLEPTDPVKATGPLNYHLTVERDDDDLVVTGEMSAPFELECGRCLNKFPYLADFPHYASDQPIEGEDAMIDLTDLVREDILVALPSYPRCEDGNVEPRQCPAEGKFDSTEEPADDEPASTPGTAAWDALDQLKNR
jgi:uncharacterized metal-binding protein YceD (DUF177 family)